MLCLKKGWLERQARSVEREIASWPEWMRRNAGIGTAGELEREVGGRELDAETLGKILGLRAFDIGLGDLRRINRLARAWHRKLVAEERRCRKLRSRKPWVRGRDRG